MGLVHQEEGKQRHGQGTCSPVQHQGINQLVYKQLCNFCVSLCQNYIKKFYTGSELSGIYSLNKFVTLRGISCFKSPQFTLHRI